MPERGELTIAAVITAGTGIIRGPAGFGAGRLFCLVVYIIMIPERKRGAAASGTDQMHCRFIRPEYVRFVTQIKIDPAAACRPINGLVVELIGVHYVVEQIDGGHRIKICLVSVAPTQEGHDLTSGAGAVRAETDLSGAGGDRVLDRPQNRLKIIILFRNIRIRIRGGRRLRAPCHPPEQIADIGTPAADGQHAVLRHRRFRACRQRDLRQQGKKQCQRKQDRADFLKSLVLFHVVFLL